MRVTVVYLSPSLSHCLYPHPLSFERALMISIEYLRELQVTRRLARRKKKESLFSFELINSSRLTVLDGQVSQGSHLSRLSDSKQLF